MSTTLGDDRPTLITGIGGFAGPFLAQDLERTGHCVLGYGVQNQGWQRGLAIAATAHRGDILDRGRLTEIIAQARPGTVYHLAAVSHVAESWARRRATLEVNVLGTETLLQAVADAAPDAIVLLASSGQVYGHTEPEAMPLHEDAPTRPTNPYAASKLCAEVLAGQWARSAQLHVRIARPFNFAGPGQAPTFVCSDFARQVARIEADLQEPVIVVGNLEARRDFIDVRDVVRGFVAAAEHGRDGCAYNLCSGCAVRVGTILETLVQLARCPIEVRVDPDRFRPADVPLFVGSPERAGQELGWSCQIPLRQTLEDTLEYWRRREAGTADVKQ